MVIGERFAWAHLPKTGGDATLGLFQLFPDLILHADARGTNSKHDSFQAREAEIRGKLLTLNIRRLPAWMLSLAQHEAKHGLYPDYRPLPLACADEIAERTSADAMLREFTSCGRLPIDRWLRTEHLRQDFLAFLREFTTLSKEQVRLVQRAPMVNAMRYDHNPRHWFTEEQIRRMYRNNPLWAAIEQEVYGSQADVAVRPWLAGGWKSGVTMPAAWLSSALSGLRSRAARPRSGLQAAPYSAASE